MADAVSVMCQARFIAGQKNTPQLARYLLRVAPYQCVACLAEQAAQNSAEQAGTASAAGCCWQGRDGGDECGDDIIIAAGGAGDGVGEVGNDRGRRHAAAHADIQRRGQ